MPRPGFVLDVDRSTPPILFHHGEGFRLERLPLGAKVIYPPDSLPGIRDVDAAIRHALLNPHGTEPLPELLRAGMRLTIVFDDLSLPLPQMQTPDVRQRIIEQVLQLLHEAPPCLRALSPREQGELARLLTKALAAAEPSPPPAHH